MRLGDNLEIALAVKDLDISLAFYGMLGYAQIGDPYAEPHPWVVLTDGTIHLGLHQYDEPSPALVYFSRRFQAVLERVRQLAIPVVQETRMEDRLVMFAFEDPNGQRIGVADLVGASIETPPSEGEMKIGKFGEYSIPTSDRDGSVAFYQQLGFEAQVYDAPYPWAIVDDGLLAIGLHQTPEFSRSTITYFSADMEDRIKWVRGQGVEPFFTNENEAGVAHEAGIQSPDGQPFFLFKEDW